MPYRSEADDACAYCHAPRAGAQASWRLDRNYLVVETTPPPVNLAAPT